MVQESPPAFPAAGSSGLRRLYATWLSRGCLCLAHPCLCLGGIAHPRPISHPLPPVLFTLGMSGGNIYTRSLSVVYHIQLPCTVVGRMRILARQQSGQSPNQNSCHSDLPKIKTVTKVFMLNIDIFSRVS